MNLFDFNSYKLFVIILLFFCISSLSESFSAFKYCSSTTIRLISSILTCLNLQFSPYLHFLNRSNLQTFQFHYACTFIRYNLSILRDDIYKKK